ncbi:MAG TPA: hypothetical protein VGG62_12970 [Terracidiphilus sp.]|jgi:hypothetical protein
MTGDKDDKNDWIDHLRAHGRPLRRADLVRDSNGVESVSMVALIANPEAYDGVKVRLIGYLHLEFEGNAIYLHREDFQNCIRKNAICIDMPADASLEQWSDLSDKYVLCEGTFRANWLGHMAMNSGMIDEVERLEPWFKRP